MEIIILLLKIIFTLFFVGYGFTAIFIPEKLRRDAFWLSPWFGTIFIAVFGVILSVARIPILQAKYIIVLASIFLFISAIFYKKKLFYISKETVLIGLFTIICLLFNLYPLLTKAGFPTTISLGNLDPISYVHTADYLIDHTVYDGGTFEHGRPATCFITVTAGEHLWF